MDLMRRTLLILAVVGCLAPQSATADVHDHEERGIGGVGAGALLGGAMVVGTFYLTDALIDEDCGGPCFGTLLVAVLAGQVTYSLGMATGITLVGNHHGGRGSFGWSFAGALLGGGVSLLSAFTESPTVFVVAYFAVPALGGAAGYWSTHRDDDDDASSTGALFQLRDGHLDLGVPLPIVVGTGAGRSPGLVLAAGTF